MPGDSVGDGVAGLGVAGLGVTEGDVAADGVAGDDAAGDANACDDAAGADGPAGAAQPVRNSATTEMVQKRRIGDSSVRGGSTISQ